MPSRALRPPAFPAAQGPPNPDFALWYWILWDDLPKEWREKLRNDEALLHSFTTARTPDALAILNNLIERTAR